MPQVSSDGRTADIPADKRLVLALEQDLGVDLLHKCGGNAMCTTCRVTFSAGEPDRMTAAERERLQDRDLLGQARLSCQILCDHDMEVEALMRLSTAGVDDPGPTPADEVTPPPEWVTPPG